MTTRRILKKNKAKTKKKLRTYKHLKHSKKQKNKKTNKQKGGMNRLINSLFGQKPDYVSKEFIDKLKPILNSKNKDALKKLLEEYNLETNKLFHITIDSKGKYIIHEKKPFTSGINASLLSILLNVPEFKKDRTIYHAFLNNGGVIPQQSYDDFDFGDDRPKKKDKPKKSKNKSQNNKSHNNKSQDDEFFDAQETNYTPVQVEDDIVKSDFEPQYVDAQSEQQPERRKNVKIKSKLDYTIEPKYDGEYNLEEEPVFWKPIFGDNEMTNLKQKITQLIQEDLKLEYNQLCSLCQMVQTIIPSFHVRLSNERPKKNETDEKEPTRYDQSIDLQKINVILCSTMLLLGVISKKMENQDYNFVFKGGKAVQVALSQVAQDSRVAQEYKSEDIDILIVHNKETIEYNREKTQNLGLHISYLVRWFLDTKFDKNIVSDIMNETNPNIVKFSYQPFGPNGSPLKTKNALMDIDFGDLPIEIKPLYNNKKKMFFGKMKPTIVLDDEELPDDGKPYFGEELLFNFQSYESQIQEKIYYYLLYSKYRSMLLNKIPITDPKYKSLNIKECDLYLTKFSKSILALIHGKLANTNNEERKSQFVMELIPYLSDYAEDDRFDETVIRDARNKLVEEYKQKY